MDEEIIREEIDNAKIRFEVRFVSLMKYFHSGFFFRQQILIQHHQPILFHIFVFVLFPIFN